MMKKALAWAAVAFLIFFVAYRPVGAANVFKSLGSDIIDIAQGFGDFFSYLVS